MDTGIIAALLGGGATIVAALIAREYSGRNVAPRAHPSLKKGAPTTSGKPDLGAILIKLDKYRQRATFGSVAGLLSREAFTLFDGYPRTPLTSWVVSKSTGKPTGQSSSEIHPALFDNPRIISSTEELRAWLANHP